MKSFIRFTVLLLFATFSSQLKAQEVSGKVLDNAGMPLPGVNIIEEGAARSTSTDFDGNFTIKSPIGARLKFSMIGFETVTKEATASMQIKMVENNKVLDEVVVVGYGTKKKGAITGSVAQINAADIVKTPAQSAIQGIQGKAAGINVVANDEPGASPTIIIRGLGTALGARNPLYVIDGLEATSLNGLSANDIASFNILKDASSVAIYGQKGANGVVLVTTKKGKKGEIKITYDSYYGQKSILKKVKLANSYRFAYYNNTALGSATYFNLTQPINTNWLEEITRTGEVTNNSVSLSGGGENVTYYLGVSNYTEKGILMGTDFKRNNFISKNEYIFSDKFKITQAVNLSVADNTPKPLNAFTDAYKQSPIVPVRYSNGRFGVPFVNTDTGYNDITGQRFNNVGNPVAELYNSHEKNKNVTLFGSIGLELQLIKHLKFNSNFGATANWEKAYSFIPNQEIWLSQNPSLSAADYLIQQPKDPINTLIQGRRDTYEWNWDNFLTYKQEFGAHDFTLVAGMSRTTTNNSEDLVAQRINVPVQSNYWYLNLSSSYKDVPTTFIRNSHTTPRVSLAYFARFDYAYENKYLVTGSIRREGISVFQPGKQWGNFSGFSVGWVITKENFMRNLSFINLLKVRGGYGQVGNGNGPLYNDITFSSNSYPFGSPSISQPGTNIGNAVDPNLTWESVNETDFGVDFALANNHITGTVDIYNKKATNLILPIVPPYVISEGTTYVNTGELTNKGTEVTLRWDDTIGQNFKYYVGGNFAQNQNKITKITNRYFDNLSNSGGTNNGEHTKAVDLNQPLGSFYVFQQIGYNSDGAPIFNDMVDGVTGLSDKDRVFAGSYIPTYNYGISLGVNFKNVDFSVDTYGVGGNKIYNGKKAQRFGGENVEYAILDNFWTPSNPNALNPKPSNDVPKASTYYIEDGAYFRINNITLGYTLPKMVKKVDKVRFYVTAVNPFIFTKYTGYSPELVGNNGGDPLGSAGIELDAYPTNKTFLVGANVSF